MLFIDLSSAFNAIIPSRLAGKLIELGLNTLYCTAACKEQLLFVYRGCDL